MSTVITAVDSTVESQFERFARATELPLAILALLIVPALVLEDRARTLQVRELAIGINWVVWLAFCVEYLGKLVLAPTRRAYVRTAWFDLLIIVLSPPFFVPQALQGVRAIRAVRLLRLLRFVRAAAVAALGLRLANEVLRHRRFHYVALATAVVVGLGAIAIYAVEHGSNSTIQSVSDGFWWAIVTTISVGYADVSPVTGEGRLIAVALMLVGISFLGVFTATVTSFFFDQGRSAEVEALEKKLDQIGAKLDVLLRAGKESR
jgi:voltage-gated potassium channel